MHNIRTIVQIEVLKMEKGRSLFQLAFPIFIESMLFMLLGVADIFMLSQYSDKAAGAVGAANQLIGNINLIFVIISAGTAVLVAQSVGAKRIDDVERVSSVSLLMNLIVGLTISSIMFFFGNPILIKIGVTPDLMAHASDYIKIVGGGLFIQAVLNTVTAIIRSYGYTRESMIITVIMNIVNIIGDAIFIFGFFGMPVLGVKGVAIATTFSRALATILVLVFMFKRVLSIKMFSRLVERPISAFVNLFKIGFPSAMENMSYNLAQTVLMSIILLNLGESAQITRTYVLTIIRFVTVFSIAIGQGSQIMIGQMIGAGKIEEAYRTGLRNFRVAMVCSITASFIMALFSRNLIGIYTKDQEIVKMAVIVLIIDAFLEPGRTFNIVLINSLRGTGDVIFPVIMAVISMWGVSVLFGYIFGVVLGFGLPGVWIATLLDEWIRGVSMLYRWQSRKWQKKISANTKTQ